MSLRRALTPTSLVSAAVEVGFDPKVTLSATRTQSRGTAGQVHLGVDRNGPSFRYSNGSRIGSVAVHHALRASLKGTHMSLNLTKAHNKGRSRARFVPA